MFPPRHTSVLVTGLTSPLAYGGLVTPAFEIIYHKNIHTLMEGMTGCNGNINNGVSGRHRKHMDIQSCPNTDTLKRHCLSLRKNVDSWMGWHKTGKEDGKCKG